MQSSTGYTICKVDIQNNPSVDTGQNVENVTFSPVYTYRDTCYFVLVSIFQDSGQNN